MKKQISKATMAILTMGLITGFGAQARALQVHCELPRGSAANERTITALDLSADGSELIATAEWAPSSRFVLRSIARDQSGNLDISGEMQGSGRVTGTFQLSVSAFTNWMGPNSKFVTKSYRGDSSDPADVYVETQEFLCSTGR